MNFVPTLLLKSFVEIAVLCLLSSAANADIITFRAFDEQGNELDYHRVVARMTNNAGKAYLSIGTFDLETLKAVSLNTEFNNHGRFALRLKGDAVRQQGIMLHWNTASTDYSTFLLDNAGQGFSRSETINLNVQLALDARRQLGQSISRRPTFEPSLSFSDLMRQVDACLQAIIPLPEEAKKGQQAQQCLDLEARAMEQLLRESGTQQARDIGDTKAKWGVTIEPYAGDMTAEYRKIDDLVDLFAPRHRWARIAMDGTSTQDYPYLADLLRYASAKDVKLLGQLFDSTQQAKIPLNQFKRLVVRTLEHPGFELFDAWEAANEVNGGWTGPDMPEKIAYATKSAKVRFPQKDVCITFYWYAMQDTLQTSLFNWIDDNITAEIRRNTDCVMLSIYIDQQPLGFTWDLVLTRLAAVFPGKDVLVGEMSYIEPEIPGIFIKQKNEQHLEVRAQQFIANRYPAAFATPSATGGGFWWYFDVDMVGKTPLWHKLRETYCHVYPTCLRLADP